MTIALNNDWTSRRNGSSNRKNPMSRPKTGSTTGAAPSGENGTRFAQSRMVSHDAATDAPIVSATRTATTTRMARAIGVRSGTSSGPNVIVRGPPSDGPPTRREPVASLRRSNQPENDAPPPDGGDSRPATDRLIRMIASEPSAAATNRPSWAPNRVQNTASNPTLWNHRASVHRSRTALATKIVTMTTRMTTHHEARKRPGRRPPSGLSGPTGRGRRGGLSSGSSPRASASRRRSSSRKSSNMSRIA